MKITVRQLRELIAEEKRNVRKSHGKWPEFTMKPKKQPFGDVAEPPNSFVVRLRDYRRDLDKITEKLVRAYTFDDILMVASELDDLSSTLKQEVLADEEGKKIAKPWGKKFFENMAISKSQIIREEVKKTMTDGYNDETDDYYTDSEDQQLAFDTYQEALSDFCQYTADSMIDVDFEVYEVFIEEAVDNFFEEYDGNWQNWVVTLKMSKEEMGADIRGGLDLALEQSPSASDD